MEVPMKGMYSKALSLLVIAGTVAPMCATGSEDVKPAVIVEQATMPAKLTFKDRFNNGFNSMKSSVSGFGTRVKGFATEQRQSLGNSFNAGRAQVASFYTGKISPRLVMPAMPKLTMPKFNMPKFAMPAFPKFAMPARRTFVRGGVIGLGSTVAAFGGLVGYGAYLKQQDLKKSGK